jgi:hypothetical protein
MGFFFFRLSFYNAKCFFCSNYPRYARIRKEENLEPTFNPKPIVRILQTFGRTRLGCLALFLK